MAMGEENKNQDLEEEELEEKETFSLPSSSSLSKIPFRPRKIRKLSPPADADDEEKPLLSPTSSPLVVLLPRPLTADGEIFAALHHLRLADPLLSPVIDTHPPPSLSFPPPSPFLSLARSILYQQLATKAAASIFQRFLSLACPQNQEQQSLLPSSVLALSPARLRQIGVSARKSSYLHDLASKFESGILSDDAILSMDDRSLSSLLTMVKGIGPWSVHMFLIFSLHRPDVLPVGDLGVRKGVQLLYGLEALPRPSEMERLCERWRPYRSVGAWYMWRLVESGGLPAAVTASVDPLQEIPELG